MLQLYQGYTHGDSYLLAKEPHEASLLRHIASQHSKYRPDWPQLHAWVAAEVSATLRRLEGAGFRLTRRLELEDLVLAAGEWKLHSPDMLGTGEGERVSSEEALASLGEQINRSIALLK